MGRTIGEAKRDQEEREGRHPQARVQRGKCSREEHEGSEDLEKLGGTMRSAAGHGG